MFPASFTPASADRLSREAVERLGERIAELSAHITAATYQLLEMVRVFDEAEGWYDQGFTSCARWLSWRTGVGPRAAREKVRVARALGELPVLSRAMERGELSYSVARAVTRVATPENEAELVEAARHSTAAQMEKLVSAWRGADRAEAVEAEAERHRSRRLTVVRDRTDGSYVVRGRLDPEAGAALEKALEAAGDELFAEEGAPDDDAEDEEQDAHRPRAARRADALGLVAEAALGEGLAGASTTADRYQVVVHVPAETLAGAREEEGEGGGSAEPPRLEGGPHLHVETARRLSCDAGVVPMFRRSGGEVLDVGRRRRTVPPATRRALVARDGGRCVFPGCECRHTDAHHLTPWAEGGETRLENLALLCRRHHRRVHEDGWRVERAGAEDEEGNGCNLHFLRPDGEELPEVAPRPEVPEDPVAQMRRDHRELGIDHWRPTPDWDGVEMDVDWALFTLGGPDRKGGSAEPSRGSKANGDVPR